MVSMIWSPGELEMLKKRTLSEPGRAIGGTETAGRWSARERQPAVTT